jgi:hypothetical protein
MNLVIVALVALLVGGLAGYGVGKKTSGVTTPPAPSQTEVKDSEVRAYIEGPLKEYLGALAYSVCALRLAAAPNAPAKDLCPPGPPDGYKPPPADGHP